MSPTEQTPTHASSNQAVNSKMAAFFDMVPTAHVTTTSLNTTPMIPRNVGRAGNVRTVANLVRERIAWKPMSVLVKIGMFAVALCDPKLTSKT